MYFADILSICASAPVCVSLRRVPRSGCAVWVRLVIHGKCDAAVTVELRAVERPSAVLKTITSPIDVYPDGRHLGRSVLHQRGNVGEVLPFEDVAVGLRNGGHWFTYF